MGVSRKTLILVWVSSTLSQEYLLKCSHIYLRKVSTSFYLPLQYSPSISSCWQPALPILFMAEGHPSSLDDEISSGPVLCLFMDLHHQRIRSVQHLYLRQFLYPIFNWITTCWYSFTGKSQKKMWVLSFVVATALVLVPAPLIEFRYYTTPFFLLFLHSQISDGTHLLFIGALYAFVDIFTMVMFLYRPFHWDQEPGTQRFLW